MTKLFYIFLIVLPIYGILVSTATHIVNTMVHESAIFFLNFMVETTIIPFLVTTFTGLGSYPVIYIILGNLLFWIPLVVIVKLISKTKDKQFNVNQN